MVQRRDTPGVPRGAALKERADKVLLERGLVATRAQAKSLIELGRVKIGALTLTKAGELVESSAEFTLDSPGYVGRGAFKLEAALAQFPVIIQGKTLIDIGASTGGFTEVLLKSGAAKVYALDVGRDQLAARLKADPRVVNMEATHILEASLPELVAGAVIDVSFISLTRIMGRVHALLAPGAWVIALIKPQFEAGLERLPKDGVVKDEGVRAQILQEVLSHFAQVGFQSQGLMDCPVEGKTGNREWLVHLVK